MKTAFLGSFVSAVHVEKACKLLQYQIKQVSHSYNVLDFILYSRERVDLLDDHVSAHKALLENDTLYNRISSYSLTYLYPKSIEGIRECSYLSFEMMISYYAVGFYLYDLLQNGTSISQRYSNRRYSTYYGYQLNFEQPEKSQIYYQEDYLSFVNDVNSYVKETIAKPSKVLAIKLDIQDYFDSVNHRTLLEIVNDLAQENDKSRLGYGVEALKALEDYLFWVTKGKGTGLPVSSQNIASNFLSHIYLVLLDDKIISILQKKAVLGYKCARYVDDIYILIELEIGSTEKDANSLAIEIKREISSFLLSKLSLKLNTKKSSDVFIQTGQEAVEFLLNEKLVSFGSLDKYFNFTNIIDYKNRLLEELRELNLKFNTLGKVQLNEASKLVINSVFHKKRMAFTQEPIFRGELETIVQEMNIDVLVETRKSLYFIFLKFDHGYERLITYLREHLYRDNNLDAHKSKILEAVITDPRYSGELDPSINAAAINGQMLWLFQKYVNRWQDGVVDKIHLSSSFTACNEVWTQVRLINLGYMKKENAKVLNHIINLIQLMTCLITEESVTNSDKYDRLKVLETLRDKISERELVLLNNCYELRHSNGISHPMNNGGFYFIELTQETILLHLNNLNSILVKIVV